MLVGSCVLLELPQRHSALVVATFVFVAEEPSAAAAAAAFCVASSPAVAVVTVLVFLQHLVLVVSSARLASHCLSGLLVVLSLWLLLPALF